MEYIWDYLDKTAYNNQSGHYKSKRQLDFILQHSAHCRECILDIAGGAGRFSIPLSAFSKNITVLDINEKAIQLLKERNKDFRTLCGDFTEVDISGVYSLIICIEALPYFSDWIAFFRKAASLLASNGRFIFTYTNPDSWRYFLRKLRRGQKPDRYTHMRFNDLQRVLGQCNLQIEIIDGMNWIPLPVTSNSPLVRLFSNIEKKLRLNNWHNQSPWLLISVKRIDI
jgi:SAM-dependent methyltransferase